MREFPKKLERFTAYPQKVNGNMLPIWGEGGCDRSQFLLYLSYNGNI